MVIKKNQCFALVFSDKGVYPQNLWAGTKKNLLAFLQIFFFFSSLFPEILSGMPTQSELRLMRIKKNNSFSHKMCGIFFKGENGNIVQKKYV